MPSTRRFARSHLYCRRVTVESGPCSRYRAASFARLLQRTSPGPRVRRRSCRGTFLQTRIPRWGALFVVPRSHPEPLRRGGAGSRCRIAESRSGIQSKLVRRGGKAGVREARAGLLRPAGRIRPSTSTTCPAALTARSSADKSMSTWASKAGWRCSTCYATRARPSLKTRAQRV
jgi:hypothetical protein